MLPEPRTLAAGKAGQVPLWQTWQIYMQPSSGRTARLDRLGEHLTRQCCRPPVNTLHTGIPEHQQPEDASARQPAHWAHMATKLRSYDDMNSNQCCLCCLKFCIFSARGLLTTSAVLGSAAHSLATCALKSLNSGQSLCTEGS